MRAVPPASARADHAAPTVRLPPPAEGADATVPVPAPAPVPTPVPTPASVRSSTRSSGWSVRARLAVAAGGLARRLSRVVRRGGGSVIGGRVILALHPRALSELTRDRTLVLVTGTNGKTTTTAMLAAALTSLGAVASNRSGANMPDGLVAALAEHPHHPYAVLEVDEGHLPAVLAATRPAVVVVLNLSRDQLDRMGEVRRTERALREALARCPGVRVVANGDDVLVASIAAATRDPVWVAAGGAWQADAASCPRCGGPVQDRAGSWWCGCGLARPRPGWVLEGQGVRTPQGAVVPVAVGVPGRANRSNAVMAVAAAVTLGAPVGPVVERVGSVSVVAGRYRRVVYRDRRVRVLLAKNPAGWQETLAVVGEHAGPVVIVINARAADGRDPSWLWDVAFERLAGRRVVVSGERAADVAVRLTYAGVAHVVVADPAAAILRVPVGSVDVIGNYTAFQELNRALRDA